ncbi:MAG: saccharopine dehydrogenase NADP-binding domain-containing protein, partial [Bacteroidota bacterium]
MKIGVLGGGGDQGSISVMDLVKQEDVNAVIVGDINPEKAQERFKDLNNDKLSVERVDVLDAEGLKNFMAKVDVVVNTTGPFYILGERVAEAAIEAKVGYVDICDDPEPTTRLLELHARAESAGVTLIIGLGCTPGATNLMALSAV